MKKIDQKKEELQKMNTLLHNRIHSLEKELQEAHEDKEESAEISPNEREEFLFKKFFSNKFEEKYLIRNLQKDILDFQELNTIMIKNNKAAVETLIGHIEEILNEHFKDIQVKLFGSYATDLCLPWSDIDLILTSRNEFEDVNTLRRLSNIIMKQPWKKSCLLIENTAIPIIKVITTDEFKGIHVDISLQDGKHFGIKCVNLVKKFLKEYETLEPLTICLKHLIYCSGLNDPYKGGLSSYGLILLIVSFLQNQVEAKRSIKAKNFNLGRLFLEFLYYYGYYFDPTKYIIYTQIPDDKGKDADGKFQVFSLM